MATLRQQLVANVTRRYPFYSGCGSFANTAIIRALGGAANTRTWSRVPGGEVLASLSEYVGRAAFYVGDLDRKITWICRQLVEPGDTVLDIGANIGIVTLWLSALVGPNGRVHAFEPNPALQGILAETFEHNARLNIQLHRFALGSETGQLELRVPKNNTGAASLVSERALLDFDVSAVPVKRLADVVASERITSVRLIKIDVEGFEAQVFDGGRDVLKRLKPRAILLEVNNRRVCDEPAVAILRELGYGFFAIPRCLTSMRLKRFDVETNEKFPGFDLLAVPKGITYEEVAQRVRA